MAYQESVISNLTDIPPIVSAFAALQGWTTDDTTPSEPIFTHPSLGGAISHKLAVRLTGTNNMDADLVWEPQSAPNAYTARARTPKLPNLVVDPFNNPLLASPTKLHTFCSLTPEPFIAIVIEFGFNLYRHLYFGYPVKVGTYDGGEIVSGTIAWDTSSQFTYDYDERFMNKYLFQGLTHDYFDDQSIAGGMHIDHVSNPEEWRGFNEGTPSLTPTTSMPADLVLGGWYDGINDGYLARGKSSFSGANILVPINLAAAMPITGDTLFIPLGCPAGVTMVHMEDLEPGQQIDVGGSDYRVFPASSKSSAETSPPSDITEGYWIENHTSYWVGYAYPEG